MVSNKGGCVCASPPPRYKNTLHFFFFVHPGSWIFATFFSFIGYEKYNTIRADPALCFLERVGKPDEKAVAAEQRANDYMDGYGRECFGASKQANLNLHAVPYSLPNWFYMSLMSLLWGILLWFYCHKVKKRNGIPEPLKFGISQLGEKCSSLLLTRILPCVNLLKLNTVSY